eukprot:GHVS01020106.1.p1 GENE.GHVS01020106.1~~GHVS01020106.1.p1  ORF type:complete len:315 (-),score=81.42 GHVS01020106.1:95-1039(-)
MTTAADFSSRHHHNADGNLSVSSSSSPFPPTTTAGRGGTSSSATTTAAISPVPVGGASSFFPSLLSSSVTASTTSSSVPVSGQLTQLPRCSSDSSISSFSPFPPISSTAIAATSKANSTPLPPTPFSCSSSSLITITAPHKSRDASSSRPSSSTATTRSTSMRRKQVFVFLLTYVGYATLYSTRKPFSVVKTHIQSELNFSTYTLGTIDTAFLAAYAVGQLTLPGFADTYGYRVVLLISYLTSAVCSLVFGLSSSPTVITYSWLLNGVSHSTAFPVMIQILAPWFGHTPTGARSVDHLTANGRDGIHCVCSVRS